MIPEEWQYRAFGIGVREFESCGSMRYFGGHEQGSVVFESEAEGDLRAEE